MDLFTAEPAPTPAPTPAPAAPACPACAAWLGNPQSSTYVEKCAQCKARHIARSPQAWRAAKGITGVDLKTVVETTFGTNAAEKGMALVWAWIERLGIGKAASK